MVEAGTALLIFSGIVAVSLPLWALIDLLQWTDSQWKRAQHDKLLWALIILLTWLPGTLAYALSVRPRLAHPQRRRPMNAGWYPDPRRRGRHRYFDGQSWTQYIVESR